MANSPRTLLAPLVCGSEDKVALIKLNTPVADHIDCFRKLWEKALLRAVVDGAVNDLDKYRHANGQPEFLPDIVTGDFDSAQPEILADYRNKDVEIINTPDQNHTDFTKCFRIVIDRISSQNLQVSCVVAFVSFTGRLDHIFGNINTLFLAKQMTSLPIYLISGDGLACLLSAGEHILDVGTGLEEGMCGLIPLGQPARRVSTTGLHWNLSEQPLEFGHVVSTSNRIDKKTVTVKTDVPLIWTMSIKTDSPFVTSNSHS